MPVSIQYLKYKFRDEYLVQLIDLLYMSCLSDNCLSQESDGGLLCYPLPFMCWIVLFSLLFLKNYFYLSILHVYVRVCVRVIILWDFFIWYCIPIPNYKFRFCLYLGGIVCIHGYCLYLGGIVWLRCCCSYKMCVYRLWMKC